MKISTRLLVLFALMIAVSRAQDPIKVEPTHYKLDFENDHVQVVYIYYGPHEKSKLHQHPQGVIVNLTDGHLRFSDATGKVQEVYSKRGEARWFPPFHHTVENLSDEAYSGVYIAVKEKESAQSSRPSQGDSDAEAVLLLKKYLLATSNPAAPSFPGNSDKH